jgi:hypothetical protein
MMSSLLTPSRQRSCDDRLLGSQMSAMRTCSGLIGPSPSEAANASAPPGHRVVRGREHQTTRFCGHRQRTRRDLGPQTLNADPLGLEHIPSTRALRKLGYGEKEGVVTRDGVTHASRVLCHTSKHRPGYVFSAAGRDPMTQS